MPVLSQDASFICEVWYDADGKPCDQSAVGAVQCRGFMMVDHVLEYDHDLQGKIQHRKCSKCGSKRDALISWLGTFTPGRIDTVQDAIASGDLPGQRYLWDEQDLQTSSKVDPDVSQSSGRTDQR